MRMSSINSTKTKTLTFNTHLLLLCVAWSFQLGCQRTGYYNGMIPPNGSNPAPVFQQAQAGYPVGPQSVFGGGQSAPQLVELQRRAQELDNNNRQLTAQIAQIQQQSTAYRERSDLLARQLEDANRQNSQLMASAQQFANQARSMQSSMTARGGARLTANNSMLASQANFQIPGAQVIPEGNGLRVRISSDQIFNPGTMQLNPIGANILDNFIQTIARQYPQQRIGIEAHTDGTVTPQIAGAQAQMVMDYLAQRGIPLQQMSASVPGNSFPIADPNGRGENRRIDIVIYN
jgi:outer membrane protein OmpA-like peptidoglycan-associated protein